MTADILERLNSSSTVTLFLPIDNAWKSLDPIERLYLESDFASDDLHRIFGMHALAQDHVTWSDAFAPGLICESNNSNN
jgi:solute carrier family 25 carnitine/acylcarnitine transporter 20/29